MIFPATNIEAERSVLGAILVNEAALGAVMDSGLDAGDFASDDNKAIFGTICALFGAERLVDELCVVEELTQRKMIDRAGGRQYISELAATCPAPGNAKAYAEVVRENGQTRRRIAASERVTAALRSGTVNGEFTELASMMEGSRKGQSAGLTSKPASEFRMRAPQKLDAAGMIFKRSLTVAFGTAGLGKTLWAMHVAAMTSRGRMDGLDGPANVLISSQEDDAEAVIVPRLDAAGADLDRVHVVSGLSLPSQVPALEARARAKAAELVIIDPIAAHLDASVDSHKDSDTRAALGPVVEMVSNLDCAALVIAHPNKSSGSSTLNRLSGSGAFGNAPRSVIVFGADPTDPDGPTGSQRIIAHAKCNVARLAPSFVVKIDAVTVEDRGWPDECPQAPHRRPLRAHRRRRTHQPQR